MNAKRRKPAPPPPRERKIAPGEKRSLKRMIDTFFADFGQHPNPIVPRATVVSRALVLVTAIMCFLACIALGTAWAVHRAAQTWTIDASRELTIQIKPVEGLSADVQVAEVLRVLEGTRGILRSHVFSQKENAGFLEPWLGAGIDLTDLPVPRLIALQLDPVVPADPAALARELSQRVPGAFLDDHRFWQAQIRSVAGWIELVAFLVMALMFGATVAIIIFATHGAMAGNRDIVDVLHLVGARQRFIASEFQRHFLMLGLKGGLIGGGAAALTFVAARAIIASIVTPLSGETAGALVQSLSIGWAGYAGIAGIVAALALLAAFTSRLSVFRHLRDMD
ncbi:MAG: ABC transporter permease [Rhodobiaceae bacterium]|nr:ABC transporter permease [Rhodobiaceae bacterium]